ncbi:GntR family transcriptional regulator [Mesorhizobium opportunistum]|uniref:GntR family transcriptional regulator n=1 Tax=Mesorhizobium opportunistum TaxID=593909 RepID=UPI0033358E93
MKKIEWFPDPEMLKRPIYLSLVEQITHAFNAGALMAGSRLPTHRQMSYRLGISIQTVNRAYEELSRRGLVISTVGIFHSEPFE